MPLYATAANVLDHGAAGDGRTNDTRAFLAAIESLPEAEVMYVPSGVYMVEVNTPSLKAGMTLEMAYDAEIKALPTKKRVSYVIKIEKTNVTVRGGTFSGERYQHLTQRGEWGHVIWIGRGARNVTIENLVTRRAWGDGIYISGASDVRIANVVSEYNRRQGLSIIDATGVTVVDSVFRHTGGTAPGAGIDLEPNEANHRIEHVTISRCTFLNNAGYGLVINGKKGLIIDVSVTDSLFAENRKDTIKSSSFPWLARRLVSWNLYHPVEVAPTRLAHGIAYPFMARLGDDDARPSSGCDLRRG
jgi:polygalacturonase